MRLDLDRIVALQTDGELPALYCVHAVSGSAYSYAGLARLLGQDQPVYGFEAPGFDNDRMPVGSLPDLAVEYTQILRAFQPEGPYQLLGWSLGGVLSFEMAKLLAEAGATVSALILVDAGLPTVMDLPPEREILRRFVRDMAGTSEESPPGLDAMYAGWSDSVVPEEAFAAVEAAGILPEEFYADLLESQYRVFRTHLEAFYSIDITGTYAGPAVHLLAQASPARDMRWDRFLPELKEITVPGTHYTIWTGDSLKAMSEIVRQTLKREP